MFLLLSALPICVEADTNALPALAPAYGELPPTFWEQHESTVIVAGFAFLAVAFLFLRGLLRPETKVILPPEVVAQMEAGKAAGIRTASPLSFPAELRRLLEEAQWTPEEVAEETNINWRTVYRHLGGEVRPNPKTRWAYERAFTERLGKQTKLPK